MKHVAVLMGGWSAEREVSLRSGKACADALERPAAIASAHRRDARHRRRAATLKPDVALNVLHGRPGEDGTMQGMLEILGIPYTHSGVLASAVAMQKDIAKTVLSGRRAGAGRHGRVAPRGGEEHVLPPPYVIKPVAEGSSVGVFIVREDHAHPPQELMRDDWTFGDKVLVEPLHSRQGTDLRGDGRRGARRHRDRADGAVLRLRGEIRARRLEAHPAGAGFVRRLRSVPPARARSARALGCRGVTRADFRYDDRSAGTGGLACLEVNTQPGMTETSLVPELAAHAGIAFAELVGWMVEDASIER